MDMYICWLTLCVGEPVTHGRPVCRSYYVTLPPPLPTVSPYPHHCHITLTNRSTSRRCTQLASYMGKPASKYTEHKLLQSGLPPKKLCLQLNVSVSKTIQWIRSSLAAWVKGDLLAGGRDATHSHTCRSISSSSPSFFAPRIIFITLLPIPVFFADVSSELLPIHVSFQADWRRNTLTVHMHRPLFSSLLFCCCYHWK